MRIFMVHEDPMRPGNPYISTLINEIRRQHPESEVSWGRDPFWNEDIYSYDIVHFHWPYTFMAKDFHTMEEFETHIRKMKDCGVQIFATCHDLESHYGQFAKYDKALTVVYSLADVIVHLGEYSQQLFLSQYPKAVNVVVEHHLYDTVYKHFPSREESIRHLGLDSDKTYILCFGVFRDNAERQLVKKLYVDLDDDKIEILAPGFMNVGTRRYIHKWVWNQLVRWYYRKQYHIHCTGWSFSSVSDDDLPYYYGAADIAFVHRVKILNSGNAVMPMLFGKVVVGPNCGNVGGLLKKWGYPVFNTTQLDLVKESVLTGLRLGREGYGKKVHDEQFKTYSTSAIVMRLYEFYSNR